MSEQSRNPRIAFVASPIAEAQHARARLAKRYGDTTPEDADIIVALGGDGLMLQTLHRFMNSGKPIYGMHRGTVGFLMNDFREDGFPERLAEAQDDADPSAADVRASMRMGIATRRMPSTKCRCSARPIRRRACAS